MVLPLQSIFGITVFESPSVFWIAPIAGVLAIAVSLLLMRRIGKMSPGGPKAVEVGEAIREGAYAFLKRQYKTIAIITVVVFVLLTIGLGIGTAAAFPRGRNCLASCWIHSHGQRY